MDYSELDALVTELGDAITKAETLSGQLTDSILQTSVGTIATLQEKIDNLKTALDSAKTTADGLKATMQAIETDVKG